MYLVRSKARRRLLALLWSDARSGTATDLASHARISFASAYRELQAMKRWELVTVTHGPDGDVYRARLEHPDADLLRRLVTPTPARSSEDAAQLRGHLAMAGAPLRADPPTSPPLPFDLLVVSGLDLARRDPEVARAFPVLLFEGFRRGEDLQAVIDRAAASGVGHVLGFFLTITSRLANEPSLGKMARALRDHRVKDQDLFLSTSPSRGSKKFALGRAWGLRMRANEDWFADLFHESVDPRRAEHRAES